MLQTSVACSAVAAPLDLLSDGVPGAPPAPRRRDGAFEKPAREIHAEKNTPRPAADSRQQEGGVPQVPREVGRHRRADEGWRPASGMVCAPACICSLFVSVRARALARPSGRRRRRRPPRAVLVGLYEEPERPPNAVDYIKRYMGAPTGIDVEALRQENENARRAASRFDAFSPLPCVPASATAATRPWSTAACRAPAFRPPRFRAPAFARFRRRPPRSFGRNAKTSVRRSTS